MFGYVFKANFVLKIKYLVKKYIEMKSFFCCGTSLLYLVNSCHFSV